MLGFPLRGAVKPLARQAHQAAAAVALTLLLAACGGGSSNKPPPPPPQTAALQVAVAGSGAVSSAPAGIDCGATCSANFALDASVTLTATPAAGQVFGGWGGDCTGTATTCTVTMSAARSVTASFNAPPPSTFALDVSVTGSGVVRSAPTGIDCGSTCSANFAANATVTLTPTPASGQSFSAWGGACTGAGATCTVTMSQARSVSATFAPTAPVRFTLSVTLTGSGSVRSAPAGIDCGSSCSASFDSGASVVLTATPAAGQQFSGWSGACSGSTATCTVAMTQARSVGAAFAAAPAAPAWQTAQRMESSDDFNVASGDARILTAIAPNGNAMVIWEQSDGVPDGDTRKVFSRRYVAGVGWDPAVPVGVSTSSSVVALAQGRLFLDDAGTATWIRPLMETRRFTVAGGWGAPFTPAGGTQGELSGAVMDAAGNIGVVVTGSAVFNNALNAGSNSWGTWAQVSAAGAPDADDADVALSANGSAMAVWRERNPGDNNSSTWAARYTAATGWQTPQRIETSFDNVHAISPPRVAIDGSGNAIALWHQGNSIHYNVFSAATASWGTATAVDVGQTSGTFAARLNLAMTADGRAVAMWNSGIFAAKAMRYTPGSGFGALENVAPYSIDRTLGIDDNGTAVVVYRSQNGWPTPTSAELNIYSRRAAWGEAWSDQAALETAAGDTKGGVAVAFNRTGQGVAAWAQNDSATSNVRNSLWSTLLR